MKRAIFITILCMLATTLVFCGCGEQEFQTSGQEAGTDNQQTMTDGTITSIVPDGFEVNFDSSTIGTSTLQYIYFNDKDASDGSAKKFFAIRYYEKFDAYEAGISIEKQYEVNGI